MDMMGSFPETEIFMEKQTKSDLSPIVTKLFQSQSPMFRPIPVNDGKNTFRIQVFDRVSQPDLFVLDIMEAIVGDDHVEIPARKIRIVIGRQNGDDVL